MCDLGGQERASPRRLLLGHGCRGCSQRGPSGLWGLPRSRRGQEGCLLWVTGRCGVWDSRGAARDLCWQCGDPCVSLLLWFLFFSMLWGFSPWTGAPTALPSYQGSLGWGGHHLTEKEDLQVFKTQAAFCFWCHRAQQESESWRLPRALCNAQRVQTPTWVGFGSVCMQGKRFLVLRKLVCLPVVRVAGLKRWGEPKVSPEHRCNLAPSVFLQHGRLSRTGAGGGGGRLDPYVRSCHLRGPQANLPGNRKGGRPYRIYWEV